MTQATDIDSREIKTAIDNIARLTESTTKAIADMTLEMRVGFANIDTKFANVDKKIELGFANVDNKFSQVEGKIDSLSQKIDGLDGKVTTLTSNVSSLDGRLWGFGLTIIAAVLAALLTIFGRYIFTGLPIVQ